MDVIPVDCKNVHYIGMELAESREVQYTDLKLVEHC
jgi:hypothetical protein